MILRITFLYQKVYELRRKAKAHLSKCYTRKKVNGQHFNKFTHIERSLNLTLCELALLNVTGAILVVGLEDLQPLIDVVVKLLELVDIDGAAGVIVEHACEGSI